jgi:hypothetical protein
VKKKSRYLIDIVIGLIILLIIISIYQHGKEKALTTIPPNGNINIIIELEDEVMLSNNSVGNSWSSIAGVNGVRIEKGDRMSLTINMAESITLMAGAEEYDKVPDRSYEKKLVNVSSLSLDDSNKYQIMVGVVENRGRYAGNAAIWNFTFSIKRIITTIDILNSIF